MWANYFGSPYLAESDFHFLINHVPVNNGVRITLSEFPNDDRLSDLNYINNIKKQIGIEWFWDPFKYNRKIPIFDNSAITKQ